MKLKIEHDSNYGFEQFLDCDNAVTMIFVSRGIDGVYPSMHEKGLKIRDRDELQEYLDGAETWHLLHVDRSQDCYVVLTKQARQAEWGRSKKKGAACLASMVAEARKVADGDVWGFVLEDDNGGHIDSCWGFVGKEYAEQEGAAALKWAVDNEKAQAAKINSIMHL